MASVASTTVWLEGAAAVAVWFVVPVLTTAALLVVHEAAHALVGWALRFRVTAIEIGAGPPWRSFWLGGTAVVLHRWPSHGLVRLVWQHRRMLRTRMIAVFLAGPATTVAGAFGLWRLACPSNGYLDLSALTQIGWLVAACTATGLAMISLLPLRFQARGPMRSDALQVLDTVRLGATGVDAILADSPRALREADFWVELLRGRLDAAQSQLGPTPVDSAGRFSWLNGASLLAFVREGVDGAMAHQRDAERTLLAEDAGAVGGDKALLQWRDEAAKVLEINSAFFLAHSPDAADRSAAAALAERWPTEARADTELRVAQLRTRGLVFLHTGRVDAGMRDLQTAWRGEEPVWLRSLCAAYLAYGHVLRAEFGKARRYCRMARRLSPRSPLTLLRLRLVDEAMQAASGRARHPAVHGAR